MQWRPGIRHGAGHRDGFHAALESRRRGAGGLEGTQKAGALSDSGGDARTVTMPKHYQDLLAMLEKEETSG